MIAFWEYDVFPYCLWGEVKEIGPDKMEGAYVKIKGYDGMAFRKSSIIAIVSKEEADPIIDMLGRQIDIWEGVKRQLREKSDIILEKLPKPRWNLLLDDHKVEGAL